MFRALLGKEWRQLRLLRWTGVGLGIGLPPFALLVAEASQRGWVPLTKISSYSAEGLLTEVVPAALLALGGLLALLIGSQAFCGDRAAGTEEFLLERPVSRGQVWQARLLAATGSVLAVAFAHATCWWSLARLLLASEPAQWPAPPHQLLGGELLVIFGGLLAGLLAAALARTPMQAVLLGFLLISLPVGLAAFAVGLFPMASYRDVPVGAVLPPLLFVGYAVTSYAMLCRGEPAGRGRWKRGAISLGVGFVALVALFVTVAPASLRLDAARFHAGGSIYARPQGDRALVMSYTRSRSAWLWDLDGERRLEFIPGPISWAQWNGVGSRLAVLHRGGPLGSVSASPRLEVFGADGEHLWGRRADPDIAFFHSARWAGRHFVVQAGLARPTRSSRRFLPQVILVADPDARTVERIELAPGWRVRLLGPAEDGAVYALVIEDSRVDGSPDARISMHRVDPERLALEPVNDWTLATGDENVSVYALSLSPSGRLVHDGATHRIFDRETDESTAVDGHHNRWLVDGEMVWLDHFDGRQVLIGPPGDPRTTLDLPPPGRIGIGVSGDRRRVLVHSSAKTNPQDKFFTVQELWLYDTRDDRWSDLMPSLAAAGLPRGWHVHWIGSDRLGITGPGLIAFQDLAPGSPVRRLVDPG